MSEGVVRLAIEGNVAHIRFDRPEARNAMTWAMYDQLATICEQLASDRSVRVAVLRGVGGEAFVAGTDIAQFQEFSGADDGIDYERRIDRVMSLLERVPMTTVAVIEGFAVGGGLVISSCCDFRIATPSARLGIPIARTLGNTLSISNIARLHAAFGVQRTKRMLLLAELFDASQALDCGFLHSVHEPAELDLAIQSLCQKAASLAPITQSIAKESLRRITTAVVPDGDDLIRWSYGSHDFREGVSAFIEKRPARWTGA